MEIKKIVVAYDGSAGSRKALSWAYGLAALANSHVVVVSVAKPPDFSSSIDEVDEYYTEGEQYYTPLLAKALEEGESQGIEVHTEILRGHPAESIVRYAVDHLADLIVMGTRGMGGFKSLIIGSVAQKVTTYSKVPVTIIK